MEGGTAYFIINTDLASAVANLNMYLPVYNKVCIVNKYSILYRSIYNSKINTLHCNQ